MGRIVSAWVTCADAEPGVVGPVTVGTPWWADAGPVVARVGAELGVPVLVLRLLRVEGGAGGRDGHVTYHVEACRPPRRELRPAPELAAPAGPDERRAAWATVEGVRELLGWAYGALARAGRPVTGAAEQVRTWNLSGLFRLPTADGPVWLKATPGFAADEAAVIGAYAGADAGLVPRVIAGAPGRLLLDDVPGEDCWDAPAEVVTGAVTRLVRAQAALAVGRQGPASAVPGDGAAGFGGGGAAYGAPDRRWAVLAGEVRAVLDRLDAAGEDAAVVERARRIAGGWPALDACGLPDTLVHGDFHPGNWRAGGGPPVVLDFADAHIGNPVLDALRVAAFLPERTRTVALRAWADAWRTAVPGCDPRRALALGAPLAHLAYAARYQEFLDGIEETERVYHRGDPASELHAALRA